MSKWHGRTSKMLDPLRETCKNCGICAIGRQMHEANGRIFDPHVFSNMKPSKVMILAQNPGFQECMDGFPLVGPSGKNLNDALELNGLSRDNFYISNIVKCHTPGNRAPTESEVLECSNILNLELATIKPRLIITLGAAAFQYLCPNEDYTSAMGKIIKGRYNVYPIYHPSPRNLTIKSRSDKFHADIRRVCALIKLAKLDDPEADIKVAT